jgi:hypothetical protein
MLSAAVKYTVNQLRASDALPWVKVVAAKNISANVGIAMQVLIDYNMGRP